MEAIIVAGIVMVGSAMAIPLTTRMIRDAKGDSSSVMVATFINSARNRAVSERRNVQLTFLPPDRIRLERIEVPSGTLTIVGELQLEGNQELLKDGAMPDTPDAFGDADAFSFTGPTPVMFTSDGSLIDSAGDPTNGTIFLERPDFPETARAVTISGVTGMLRTWKWRGSEWLQ
ncbi:MAG: GspH/FimT family pseudopilin [Vicinamibacterales bacterium]